MSTNLKYRERERWRKRESRRQASEAQQTKGRERCRARDKKQTNKGDIFWLEEKHENFVAVVTKGGKVAATNVKMSGSEKEVNENMYDISSEKRVTCGSFTLYT